MPAGVPAMVALANTTLSGSAATVTFSSISGSYRDLVLVMDAYGTSAGQNTFIQLNNVTTGLAYFGVTMEGSGSAASSVSYNVNNGIYAAYNLSDITTTQNTAYIWNILDYAATDKHKTVLVRSNRPNGSLSATAGRFASTSAITTISIQLSGGSWAAGSTFALYGVSSS